MSMSSVNAIGVTPVATVDRVSRQSAAVAAAEVEPSRAATPAPAAPPASARDLEAATAQIERFVRSAGRSLQFRVDDDSGRVVVSVRDSDTGELIRQIPSEAALRIARALDRGEMPAERVLIEEKA